MRQNDAFIVSAVRTPIGKFLGALSSKKATELGSHAIGEALARAGAPAEHIDEVFFGNVVSAGLGQAPARQAALGAGVPASIPCTTINKVCGSGMKAIMLAAQAIRAGDGDLFVAGGMESMTNAPYLMTKARTGYRLGHGELLDSNISDGLWCATEDEHMGTLAEFIAKKHKIDRRSQDEWALISHQRAVEATANGVFQDEIAPVTITDRRGNETTVADDEGPRPGSSMEALGRLRPIFTKDGTVTAGNAPGLSDGAAAVIVASSGAIERFGLKPIARIKSYANAATEPKLIFEAPVLAMRRLIEKQQASLGSFDLIEVNEAFAAQFLANGRALDLDYDRVNVNGGAVALGHPVGATGARMVVTLINALRNRDQEQGVAALCLGGGEAVAMSLELAD